MVDRAEHVDDGRDETPRERADRNLAEMTGELRVVITGIQVLFAFLLVVPFDGGFRSIGEFERATYFVTLVLAALAVVCLIAPSAAHRVLFRRDDKPYLVGTGNRQVIAGLVFLALAMCGSLTLVASKLFGPGAGVATLVLAAAVFGTVWFGLPLRRRRRRRREQRRNASPPAGGRSSRPAGAAEGR
jgi:hypothetical protein